MQVTPSPSPAPTLSPRLRPSSGFHYGLAMCSGDRQFLAQVLGLACRLARSVPRVWAPLSSTLPVTRDALLPQSPHGVTTAGITGSSYPLLLLSPASRLATCMKEKGLRLSSSPLPCPPPEDGGTSLQSNPTQVSTLTSCPPTSLLLQAATDHQNSAIFKELSFPTPTPPTSLPNFKVKPYDNPGARAAPYPASYSRAASYAAISPHQPTRSPTPSPAPNVTVPHPVNHTQSLPPTSYPPNAFLPSPYPSQTSPSHLHQPSRPPSTYNPQAASPSPAPHDLSRPTAPQTPSYYLPPAPPAPTYYRPHTPLNLFSPPNQNRKPKKCLRSVLSKKKV